MMTLVLAALALAAGPDTAPPPATPLGTLAVTGEVRGAGDVSAAGVVGDLIVLASDETGGVAVLRRAGDKVALLREIPLDAGGAEIDIEAVACDGDIVYAAGSHAGVRKAKPKEDYARNRDLIGRVNFAPSRDAVYRFRLAPDGTASAAGRVSLRAAIERNEVLRPFARLASKENGVDIEGLAVKGGTLYAGFRGPVLAGGLAAVLAFRFDDPAATAELRFVPLGGLGVRDLAAVSDGFLILAGPVGVEPGPFRVYHWDGGDGLRGVRASGTPGAVRPLATLPEDGKSSPEGLAVVKESAGGYEVLVVRDGVKGGGPAFFAVPR